MQNFAFPKPQNLDNSKLFIIFALDFKIRDAYETYLGWLFLTPRPAKALEQD